MNLIDSNVVMAIIAFSAVISPIATTLLNNYHQLKMLKLKNYELAKYKAIDDFIKSTENYYCDQETIESFVNFNSSIANLYIYFSIIDHSIFDKLKECIKNEDYNKTQFAIGELVKLLSKQIHKE